MGALDYLAKFCTVDTRKKKKTMQTVSLKVKMDCEGCERRVKNTLSSMKGVKFVEVNRKITKAVVTGYITPKKVMKRVRSTGKRPEPWPYVQYNLVAYPYVAQAYDKKARSGFVKNAPQAAASPTNPKDRMVYIFSDDNPNACSLM